MRDPKKKIDPFPDDIHLFNLFLLFISAARAQIQSDGSMGVIAFVVRRSQLEDFWLSLELLEANFLYCYPYPVVVFAGDDFTDTEVVSIREKLPTALSVTFELICLDNCVSGLSTVDEIKGLMATNSVKMGLGKLNKERFLAGEIFRHPALADYDYLWYMEPTTFLLVGGSFLLLEANSRGLILITSFFVFFFSM